MFEKNKTIHKIDARNAFVDVQAAFNLDGKVVFQFRKYNPKNKSGSKITESIDFFMSPKELTYFAKILETGRIWSMLQQENMGQTYPKPGYVCYGGTNDGETVISRKLQIEKSQVGDCAFAVYAGQGKVGPQGQITPMYLDKDARKIFIPVSERDCIILASELQRALRYYDNWKMNGVFEAKWNELDQKIKSETGKHKDKQMGEVHQFPQQQQQQNWGQPQQPVVQQMMPVEASYY